MNAKQARRDLAVMLKRIIKIINSAAVSGALNDYDKRMLVTDEIEECVLDLREGWENEDDEET